MDIIFSSNLLAISGILTSLLLYNLWKFKVKNRSYKAENGLSSLPPEPSRALPILGHLHILGKEKTLARTLGRLADKHGPIFTIWLGVHRTVVISSPDAIKECFTTNDKVLGARPRSSHGQYLSYNYAAFGFASYGPYWRNMRKMVLIQLLSSHRIKSLKHVQVSEVNLLIKELYLKSKTNNKIVMSECFEHLTLNMITKMIAGKRYLNSNSEEEEGKRTGKLMKEFMYISGVLVPSDLIPFLGWMNFRGPVKTMKRLSTELDSLMQSWIDEHKLKRLRMDHHSVNIQDEDFIDVMLSVLEDDFFGHSKESIIKGTVMTLIIAGADTTSITLTWILSNLLNNRRTLELAQEELDLNVGRNRVVQDSDIHNLNYLKAIVKETLRLYPPGPLAVPREATEDCSIASYHIPKGTRVFANLWKLHRDPNVWSNPDEFMPERFLTHNQADVFGQNFEYLPFGSGRRSCPGMNFAIQAIELSLARLLQAFSIRTPLNVRVDMSEGLGITLPKTSPLEIQIFPRLSSQLYEC
ncbi:cytochrome P450 CYP82J17-like [Mercurialis annua]|uniref:cytochrome P450 CYP82J17-like n=1 Tax=Mercurialis annua TaxID=3986 RepID=UPI00215F38A2|nr:cytochrome P450 CYP82J17-like [Mercurialis annua]